jgi:hypothetical protein|tara:strand:- start:4338 stop:4697 length:360 start_codon:yes stop_codon:yes gene_type:complete
MTAPNIVNVTTITGKTAVANSTTSASNIVENTAASGKVIKVNMLSAANVDGVADGDITVNLVRSSTNYAYAHGLNVPAQATMVIITKDSGIYLEEGDALTIESTVNGDVQVICSYEEIS